MPIFSISSATSLPTFRQSVSLPPKILNCLVAKSASMACLRDSATQSAVWLPPATANGRTPQRSAIMSAAVRGVASFSSLLALSRIKCRSASLTPTSGLETWVSVVPIQVFGPMGMTKNNRPSEAKNAMMCRCSVIRSTIRCTPLEKRW